VGPLVEVLTGWCGGELRWPIAGGPGAVARSAGGCERDVELAGHELKGIGDAHAVEIGDIAPAAGHAAGLARALGELGKDEAAAVAVIVAVAFDLDAVGCDQRPRFDGELKERRRAVAGALVVA
jgi:hypothetical protein